MNRTAASLAAIVAICAMALVPLTINACAKRPPEVEDGAAQPLSPAEAAAIVGAARGVAEVGGSIARQDGDAPACITGYAVAEALKVAQDVLLDLDEDRQLNTIPEVAVDVSMCAPDTATDTDTAQPAREWDPARVSQIVEAALGAVAPVIAVVDMDCRARVYTLAGLSYARGATGPIFDEINKPDGVVTVPAVSVSVASCE